MALEGIRKVTPDTITAAVQTVEKGLSCSRSDLLAIEEPLQLCLNGFPLSITMRTPGSDLDLATGFLFTEGIIDDVGQILSMRAESAEDSPENPGDRVTIGLRHDIAIDPRRIRRNFYTSSSCGVCGKLAIGAIEVRPSRPMRQSGPQLHADLIYRLPDLLRRAQDCSEILPRILPETQSPRHRTEDVLKFSAFLRDMKKQSPRSVYNKF